MNDIFIKFLSHPHELHLYYYVVTSIASISTYGLSDINIVELTLFSYVYSYLYF